MATPGSEDSTSTNDAKNGADKANYQTPDTSYHSAAEGGQTASTSAQPNHGSDTGNANDDTAATDTDTPATGGHNAEAPRVTGLTHTLDADEASDCKGSTPAAGAMAKFFGGRNMVHDSADTTPNTTTVTATSTVTIPAPLQLLKQSTSSKMRRPRPMPDMTALEAGVSSRSASPSIKNDRSGTAEESISGASMDSLRAAPPSPQLVCPPTPQRMPAWVYNGPPSYYK